MSKLVEVLSNATQEDFDALTVRIQELQSELDSLLEVQKVIGLRLGLIEKKKWGGGRKPAAANVESGQDSVAEEDSDAPTPPVGTTRTEFYRKLASEYIQANGPKPLADICRHTRIPSGSITAVVKHPMFVKTAIGYGLAKNHR